MRDVERIKDSKYAQAPDLRSYSAFRTLLRSVVALTGREITASGKENIPEGPVLFAITHRGLSDIPVMALAVPDHMRLRFVAKEELYSHKLLGPVMKNNGTIPINRVKPHPDFFHNVISGLQAEKDPYVSIAAEGGIKPGEKVGKVISGIAWAACFTNVSIVPAGIAGPEAAPGNFMPGRRSHVHFGEPRTFEPVEEYSRDMDLSLRPSNETLARNMPYIRSNNEWLQTALQEAYDIAQARNSA